MKEKLLSVLLTLVMVLTLLPISVFAAGEKADLTESNVTAATLKDVENKVTTLYQDNTYQVKATKAAGTDYDMDVKVDAKELAYHAGEYNGQTKAYWVGVSFKCKDNQANGYKCWAKDTLAELDEESPDFSKHLEKPDDTYNLYFDAAEYIAKSDKVAYVKLEWYKGKQEDLSQNELISSTTYKIDFTGITLKHEDPTAMTATLKAVSPAGVQDTNTLTVTKVNKAVKYYYKVVDEQTQAANAQSEHTIYDFASNGYTAAEATAVEGDAAGVQVKVTTAQYVEVYAVSTSGKIQGFVCLQGQEDNYVPAPKFESTTVDAKDSTNKTFDLTIADEAAATEYIIYKAATGEEKLTEGAAVTPREKALSVSLKEAISGASIKAYVAASDGTNESARVEVTVNRYKAKSDAALTKISAESDAFTAIENPPAGGSTFGEIVEVPIDVPYKAGEGSTIKIQLTASDKATVEYSTSYAGNASEIKTPYEDGISNVTVKYQEPATVYVKVTAEDTETKGFYKLVLTMVEPLHNADIQSATIAEQATTITPVVAEGTGSSYDDPAEITNTVKFAKSEDLHEAVISLTVDPTATVKATSSAPSDDTSFDKTGTVDPEAGTVTFSDPEGSKFDLGTSGDDTEKAVYVMVTAQDGTTKHYYKITASREEASNNTALKSITVNDVEVTGINVAGTETLDEAPIITYDQLPFKLGGDSSVTVSVTTAHDYAKVAGKASPENEGAITDETSNTVTVSSVTVTYDAETNNGTTIGIKVVAEDGETTAYYKLVIKMVAPLEIANLTEPVVVDNYTAEKTADDADHDGSEATKAIEYTVTVPKGKQSTMSSSTITFTVDPTATVKVSASTDSFADSSVTNTEGAVEVKTQDLTSGKAVYIEVTAQDGSTHMYYKVTAKDDETIALAEDSGQATIDANEIMDKLTDPAHDAAAVEAAVNDGATGFTSVDDALAADAYEKAVAEREADWSDEDALKELIKEADPNHDEVSESVTVSVVTYLDVTVESYNKTTYVLDLTPKFYVAASTKTKATDMKFEGNDLNAVKVVPDTELEGVKNVEVKVTMPEGMDKISTGTDETVYINHAGKITKATTEATRVIKFTAESFSPYSFSTTDSSVAKIDSTGYTSLQDAVNAVKTDGTATSNILLQAAANELGTVTVTAPAPAEGKETYSFKITKSPSTLDLTNITVNAPSGYKVSTAPESVDGSTADVTYTIAKDSSSPVTPSGPDNPGSSSSGPSASANVNTVSAKNGSFTISDRNAKSGDTVKVTPKANDGYVVDAVKVTDKNGNEIAVTKNDDGTYSFVMPDADALPVKVEVTFKLDDAEKDCPSEKFTDVDQSLWYHEAVDYVIKNGLMKGMSDTTFEPNTTTSRAMVVTILYRLEGQPAVTEESPFTDVPAGQWYSDAINWAAANGIVKGMTETEFCPDDTITREQMAAILYRYADYKKIEVTDQSDLADFTDAASVSTWADTAMRWAVAQGLIQGTAPTTLEPAGNSTRAQVATVLMRFCEDVAK